jgi:hypothetical protein
MTYVIHITILRKLDLIIIQNWNVFASEPLARFDARTLTHKEKIANRVIKFIRLEVDRYLQALNVLCVYNAIPLIQCTSIESSCFYIEYSP